jgi:CcmD family protein
MSKYLKYFLLTLLAGINSICLLAQNNNEVPQMADAMRANGKIYVVVAVVGIILLGIFLYVIRLDKKVTQLEKKEK